MQTGLTDFDEITEGLEPGQLLVVAARPSVGKTAFGMNIADHVTRRRKKAVAFFSMEMTKRELTQRLIAMRTGVSVAAQCSGKLDGDQWAKISECQAGIEGEQLFLIGHPAIGVPYARAVARKLKRQHGLDLIVLDYIGLMKGEGQNRTPKPNAGNRQYRQQSAQDIRRFRPVLVRIRTYAARAGRTGYRSYADLGRPSAHSQFGTFLQHQNFQ